MGCIYSGDSERNETRALLQQFVGGDVGRYRSRLAFQGFAFMVGAGSDGYACC